MSLILRKICGHLKSINGIHGVFTHMPENPKFPYITIDFKNIQQGVGDSAKHLCRTEHICVKIFSLYQGIKEILKLTESVIAELENLDLGEASEFIAIKVNNMNFSSLKEGIHMAEFYVDVLIKS